MDVSPFLKVRAEKAGSEKIAVKAANDRIKKIQSIGRSLGLPPQPASGDAVV
jgi:hypothetical protein